MLQMERLMTQNKLQANDQSISRPINQCLPAGPAPFMSVLHSPYLSIKLSHTIMSWSLFLSSHPRTSGSLLFKTILRPGGQDSTLFWFSAHNTIWLKFYFALFTAHCWVVATPPPRCPARLNGATWLRRGWMASFFCLFVYFLMPAAASRFQPLTNKGWIVHAAEQTKWNRSFHIDGDHSVLFFFLSQHRSWSAE